MAQVIQFSNSILTPESIQDNMDKFYNYLIVYKCLKDSSIKVLCRIVSKALLEMNSIFPTITQMEEYMVWVHKQSFTYSYINNIALSLERYAEFLKTPVKFGRKKKTRNVFKDVLTPAEVSIILAFTKTIKEKAILSLLAYSGLRNQEICNLKVKDIDFSSNQLIINLGKGDKNRVVNIDGLCINILYKYLKEYQKPNKEYLFTTIRHNNKYQTYIIRRLVKKVVKRTNIKKRVYPHLFRHSLACHLIENGANIISVQNHLGHSCIETTMKYITANPRRVKLQYQNYVPSYL